MNELHAIINSITSAAGILGVIWLAAVKVTRIEVKVDTMWGMLLKRAVVEGVHTGLMELKSPVKLVNDSGRMLEAMADDLRVFYRAKCVGLDEPVAALMIEKEFGTRLATEICIPNNISMGVCIIIALAVAKDSETLTEILDDKLPAAPGWVSQT